MPILLGPAPVARDGIRPGFGPPPLGFMLDICTRVWSLDTLVSGPNLIRLILVLLSVQNGFLFILLFSPLWIRFSYVFMFVLQNKRNTKTCGNH